MSFQSNVPDKSYPQAGRFNTENDLLLVQFVIHPCKELKK